MGDGGKGIITVRKASCGKKADRTKHVESDASRFCHSAEDFFHVEADCHLGKVEDERVESDYGEGTEQGEAVDGAGSQEAKERLEGYRHHH
jgi:hypothetical protein